jgi:glycosyltransferase involved in cell wall biosynthesis
MHLLVDVQALQTPSSRVRGIGRYSRNLLAGLVAVRPGWQIELVQSTHQPPPNLDRLGGLPLTSFTPPLPFDPENKQANEQYYGDWLTARGADAILLCSAVEREAVVPEFTGPRPPLFTVLYDLIPLLFADHYLGDPVTCARYARGIRQLLQADCLLAISQSAADDACRLFADPRPRVVSISGACDPGFAPYGAAELQCFRDDFRARFRLDREFLFYVGGFDHRKNMGGALRAYAALPPAVRAGLDLVIACKLTDSERAHLEGGARELGVADSLRLTGYVSDDELRALYQLCRVFFFPSLYEGMGLPVVEALRCGAPVVASDRSSIPEFAGDVSWLADPESPEDLARAVRAALAEPRDARREQRQRFAEAFRWEKVAERACRELEAAAPQAPPRRRRKRVAWVSPLPPAASGIADYSADLLRHAAYRFDIELVVDPAESVVPEELANKYPVLRGDEVLTRHRTRPYDAFVYHVGNSAYHVYMLDLLWRYHGLVVLHDIALGGLVLTALHRGLWPVSLRQELEREGHGHVADWVDQNGLDWAHVIDNCPLNRRVLESALGVIVHSHSSWRQVRQLTDVPVVRVPMAVDVPRLVAPEAERAWLGLPSDAYVICTVGLVGWAKRTPSLLRAVAGLPPHVRERALLVFVGEGSGAVEEATRKAADELGIGGAIRWAGRVPLRQVSAYARAADVCVQLRYPARGETSAALLRELAAGAGCVVSDQGSLGELPDDVALKVRTPDHEVEDLTAALTRLHDDPALRTALGHGALRYVQQHHGMGDVLRRYGAMIEMTAARRAATDRLWVEYAADALAASAGRAEAEALLGPWADLRRQGQERLAGAGRPAAPRELALSA